MSQAKLVIAILQAEFLQALKWDQLLQCVVDVRLYKTNLH